MKERSFFESEMAALAFTMLLIPVVGAADDAGKAPSSCAPVVINEDFMAIFARMKAAKSEVEKRQADLLGARYDLSDRPAKGITMSRGKAVQEGVRVKLAAGTTWETLASMAPEEIRDKDLFPAGFVGEETEARGIDPIHFRAARSNPFVYSLEDSINHFDSTSLGINNGGCWLGGRRSSRIARAQCSWTNQTQSA